MTLPTKRDENGNRIEVTHTAYIVTDYTDDGKRVLCVENHATGDVWTEPLDGWELVMSICTGQSPFYRYKRNGKTYYMD